MNSLVDRALTLSARYGMAYGKFLAPNDTKQTGSHQAGFLISVEAGKQWLKPVRAGIAEKPITIHWYATDHELTTQSCLKYYASKREYRITQLGRHFPLREPHLAGSLFLCIPASSSIFHVFLFDNANAIDDVLAGLLLSAADLPTLWTSQRTRSDTLNMLIAEFIQSIDSTFPSTEVMAAVGREFAEKTDPLLRRQSWDHQLLEWVRTEYEVFRAVELHFFLQEDRAQWADVDRFLATANSMMNRRKARAGKSLEHHVAAMLTTSRIPFTPQARTEKGHVADFLLPSVDAYHSRRCAAEHLVFLAVKTTCKDRWRQILTEADEIPVKYLLTLQQTLSSDQLQQMHDRSVRLVVPEPYHSGYSEVEGAHILTVDNFVKMLIQRYPCWGAQVTTID
jgi:hypothetical protein